LIGWQLRPVAWISRAGSLVLVAHHLARTKGRQNTPLELRGSNQARGLVDPVWQAWDQVEARLVAKGYTVYREVHQSEWGSRDLISMDVAW